MWPGMPSAETIYHDAIRPLPIEEQKRLADLILKGVEAEERSAKPRRSALEILESIRATAPRRTAAEIDEYLREERHSWDD